MLKTKWDTLCIYSMLFEVELRTWDPSFTYPLGAVVGVIDPANSVEAGIHIYNRQYKISETYPEKVAALAKAHATKSARIVEKELANREDLRHLHMVTIDPPESLDLDDGLTLELLHDEENFKNRVGIHIADPTHVIDLKDPLDIEAYRRCATAYPIEGRSFPMLPRDLSHDSLSLHEGEDRLALSVFVDLDDAGNFDHRKEPKIMTSVVKSKRRLTYGGAQTILMQQPSGESVQTQDTIRRLGSLAALRRRGRLNEGVFVIQTYPNWTVESDESEAHRLVEEFMIIANHWVAIFLNKHFPKQQLVRRQLTPMASQVNAWMERFKGIVPSSFSLRHIAMKMNQLKKIMEERTQDQNKGFTSTTEFVLFKDIFQQLLSAPPHLARKLIWAEDRHPLIQRALVNWYKLQYRGEIVCTATVQSEKELFHFGLDLNLYTWFTSPLRRYVDMVVHRQVKAALRKKPSPFSRGDLIKISDRYNRRQTMLKKYENEIRNLHFAEFLSKRPRYLDLPVSSLDDSELTFSIPSMRGLKSVTNSLKLNLLHPCEKPTIISGEGNGVVRWERRIYSATAVGDKGRPSNTEFRWVAVDPHRFGVVLPASVWQQLQHMSTRAPDGQCQGVLRDVMTRYEMQASKRPRNEQLITSEMCGDLPISRHQCRFSLHLHPGVQVRLQMAARMQRGWLTAVPQLLAVDDKMSICVEHIDEPIFCFARPVAVHSKKKYISCGEYVDVWKPIIELEAVKNATCDDEGIVIKDVAVSFFKNDQEKLCGKFELSIARCKERHLKFVREKKDEGDQEEAVVDGGEDPDRYYVCIRVRISWEQSH